MSFHSVLRSKKETARCDLLQHAFKCIQKIHKLLRPGSLYHEDMISQGRTKVSEEGNATVIRINEPVFSCLHELITRSNSRSLFMEIELSESVIRLV